MTAKPPPQPHPGQLNLFGESASETLPVTGALLSAGLHHSAHGDKEAALALTRPGMAAIAASELGKTCRECLYFADGADTKRDHWRVLKPGPCHLFCKQVRASPRSAPKLPHDNCACRSFLLNAHAPEAEKWG
jgi:hypothetical protein